MKASFLFLLLCSMLHTSETSDIELPITIDASGVPSCIEACLSEFFYSAAQLIHLHNPIERLHEMCRDYENASMCINKHKEICYQSTIFEVALSGIEELCNEREQDVMDYKDCLETYSELALKSCDDKCLFTDVLMMLSGRHSTNGLQELHNYRGALQKKLASICTTFGCMSSCVAGDLNTHCSPVGTIIIKTLMKPFFTVSTIFEEIGPRSKLSLYRQFPPQCYYLVDTQEVNGVANGRAPSNEMSKTPEEAVLKEITAKEALKKKKKAELEKLFLMEALRGM